MPGVADKVQGGLPHDVVVGEGAVVFEALASENNTLLGDWKNVHGDGQHVHGVLDLLLHGEDCVQGLHVEGERRALKWHDDDLHLGCGGRGVERCCQQEHRNEDV